MAYYFVRGFRGNGEPWYDPSQGYAETKFPLSGDPLTGTGWVLADNIPAGTSCDIQMVPASGPFTLAPGEVQDIVIGIVVGDGGEVGGDNLASVALMKQNDAQAQWTYDSNFAVPESVPETQVQVSALDGQILLSWDDAAADYASEGYAFEGYNVWMAYKNSEWVRMATFDLENRVTRIWGEWFDADQSAIVNGPVQFGSDSGVQYHFLVDMNHVTGDTLVNGKTYQFAVTGYAYNENGVPKTLEGAPVSVDGVPQRPVLDTQLNASYGSEVAISHEGPASGSVAVMVVDPSQITGHDYSITFYEKDASYVWKLTDVTAGIAVLRDMPLGGDEAFADGLSVQVSSSSTGLTGVVEVANATYPNGLPETEWDATGAPYEGNNVWLSSLSANSDKLENGGNGRFIISYQSSIYLGDLSRCHDYELRWTEKGSWATWNYDDGTFAKVPWELWDIGAATPDDPSDDEQMVGILYAVGGTVGVWDIPNGDNVEGYLGLYPCSDRIYFYYVDSPGASYADFEAFCEAGDYASADALWGNVYDRPLARIVVVNYDAEGDPSEGTVVRFLTNKANTAVDTYTFSTAGLEPTQSAETAKARLDEIGVFPNPYMGSVTISGTVYSDWITFNGLPADKCTIRIFSLSGSLVRTLQHDNGTPFERWDVLNDSGRGVADGMYIAHVETAYGHRVLKLAITRQDVRFE